MGAGDDGANEYLIQPVIRRPLSACFNFLARRIKTKNSSKGGNVIFVQETLKLWNGHESLWTSLVQ